MKLRRIEKNNIPFRLHDSKIIKIETSSDKLTFYLDNVYEYSDNSEKYYPAKMIFKEVDFDECNVMIFDRQIVNGNFAGIRCGIKEFNENYGEAKFEILTETYGGYNTILNGLIWKEGCEPVSGIITIWTVGDIVFDF